jgi:hypothetical protein
MWDRALDFPGFVRHYGLKRSEGVLLRYLSDVFKTLTRSVPIDASDEVLDEIGTWLGAVIKATDSSLLDEWQALLDGVDADTAAVPVVVALAPGAIAVPDDDTALRALVRTRVFRWVQYAAAARWDEWSADLADAGDVRWSATRLSEAFAAVGSVSAATDARRNDLYALDDGGPEWRVSQRLVVDTDVSEWCLDVAIDVAATGASGEIVATLRGIEPN